MLVFFFVLLIIIGFIILLLAVTTLQLQIDNLKVKNNKREEGEVKLVFKILNIIPYFEINLLENRMLRKKVNLKKLEKKMKDSKLKLDKNTIKQILGIMKVEELFLKVNLESNNMILITFATVIISTILSVIFTKNMLNKDDGKYKIDMSYAEETKYEILLRSIINIKFIHIISIMCEINKRKRADKNARKSYRRSYEYNYE